mmetsp:Transcript_8743/g.16215  ORF Transcript_8743/g.16215 Transcript_8743/m.16215 type:complete len:153 (+) Transcript_8743:160-618(+)
MVFSFSVEPRQPNTASASSGGGSDKKKSEETRSDKARLRGLRKRARYVAKKIRKRPSSLLPQVTKYMQLKDESVRDCTTAEREEYSSAVKAKISAPIISAPAVTPSSTPAVTASFTFTPSSVPPAATKGEGKEKVASQSILGAALAEMSKTK